MERDHFFSIVTPTMWRDTLADLATDLNAQSFKDFEWVVVPDPEANQNLRLLSAVSGEFRTRVLNTRWKDLHAGPKGNGLRDFALHRIRGEWVCFLDDDDIAYPQYLERFRELISGEVRMVLQPARGTKKPRLDGFQQGSISGQCVAVHHSIAKDFDWAKEDRPLADWRWMSAVRKSLEKDQVVENLKGEPEVFVNGRAG